MKHWHIVGLALLSILGSGGLQPASAQTSDALPQGNKIELPRDIKWTSGLNQQQPPNPNLPAADKIVLPRDIKWTSGLVLPGSDGPTVPTNPPTPPDMQGGFGQGSNAGSQGGFGQGSNAGIQGGFGQGSNAGSQGGFGQGSNAGIQGGFGQGSHAGMQGGFGQRSNVGVQGGFGGTSYANSGAQNRPGTGVTPVPGVAQPQFRFQSNVDPSGRSRFSGNNRQLTNPETGSSTFSGFGQPPTPQVTQEQLVPQDPQVMQEPQVPQSP